MSLADQISKNRGQPATVRIGVVSDVSPLVVTVQQTEVTNVGMLSDFFPVVGDVVALLGQSAVSADGSSWLALGRVVDPSFSQWTTGSPALTGSGGNPTGYTSSSRWTRNGSTVIMLFTIVMGAVPGAGNYSISLPVTAFNTGSTSGTVRLFDSSTGNAHFGRLATNTTTTLGLQVTLAFGGGLANVGAATPWVWAAGDIIDGFIIYEAA